MRVFHQNESYLACPHPPSSYEGGREQVGSSHFDRTLRYGLDTVRKLAITISQDPLETFLKPLKAYEGSQAIGCSDPRQKS